MKTKRIYDIIASVSLYIEWRMANLYEWALDHKYKGSGFRISYKDYFDRQEKKIEDDFEDSWDDEFNNYWMPLLYRHGAFSQKRIKNEMHDLVFIFSQVGRIYKHLTGGLLSKPMYDASTIIDLHEEECQKSYLEGLKDAAIERAAE